MYCVNCGAKIDDGSSFCSNCGQPVEGVPFIENATSEEICEGEEDTGKKETTEIPESPKDSDLHEESEIKTESRLDAGKIKETLSSGAGKAIGSTLGLTEQMSKKMEEKKKAYSDQIEEEARKKREEQKRKKEELIANSTKYMSSKELWSWLKESANRQIFFIGDAERVSSEEYIEKLEEKLTENDVPVTIEEREITWDDSNYKKKDYFIIPHTEVVNPLSYLLQFNHVGKFTFVEEKTFITPPDLPEKPDNPKPLDSQLARLVGTLMTYGVVSFIVGIVLMNIRPLAGVGVLLILAGIGMFGYAFLKNSDIKAIKEFNKKCAEQRRLYNLAWENWYQAVFLHNFQEGINGELSRIYDSANECIKQLNEALFPHITRTETESSSMNELEQLIERRKNEYR